MSHYTALYSKNINEYFDKMWKGICRDPILATIATSALRQG